MTTLKRVLLSTVCLVLSCMTACGGVDELGDPLNWRFGDVWRGTATISAAGMPATSAPLSLVVSVSDRTLGVDGLCGPSVTAHLDIDGHGDDATWRGVLVCPYAVIGSCEQVRLEYNSLELTFDRVTQYVGVSGQVVLSGCGAPANGSVRMVATPQ